MGRRRRTPPEPEEVKLIEENPQPEEATLEIPTPAETPVETPKEIPKEPELESEPKGEPPKEPEKTETPKVKTEEPNPEKRKPTTIVRDLK